MKWEGPGPGERLLVLAPHPDDESLAFGFFDEGGWVEVNGPPDDDAG
ncbi:MAG: hypothetical protein AAB249_00640 [Acidobacteriota bacterium]|jgi:hypothetical protein